MLQSRLLIIHREDGTGTQLVFTARERMEDGTGTQLVFTARKRSRGPNRHLSLAPPTGRSPDSPASSPPNDPGRRRPARRPRAQSTIAPTQAPLRSGRPRSHPARSGHPPTAPRRTGPIRPDGPSGGPFSGTGALRPADPARPPMFNMTSLARGRAAEWSIEIAYR